MFSTILNAFSPIRVKDFDSEFKTNSPWLHSEGTSTVLRIYTDSDMMRRCFKILEVLMLCYKHCRHTVSKNSKHSQRQIYDKKNTRNWHGKLQWVHSPLTLLNSKNRLTTSVTAQNPTRSTACQEQGSGKHFGKLCTLKKNFSRPKWVHSCVY